VRVSSASHDMPTHLRESTPCNDITHMTYRDRVVGTGGLAGAARRKRHLDHRRPRDELVCSLFLSLCRSLSLSCSFSLTRAHAHNLLSYLFLFQTPPLPFTHTYANPCAWSHPLHSGTHRHQQEGRARIHLARN